MAESELEPITSKRIPGTDVPDVTAAENLEAREKQWLSNVAVSTAVMAALAAVTSMYSGGHLNEAMVDQIRASDQWSHYQAKSIKAAIVESRIDAAEDAKLTPDPADVARLTRYKSEQDQISTEAKAKQKEADRHRRRYTLMARAATGFQVGIGIAAVAMLRRKNIFWAMGILCGVVGLVFAVMGVLA
jgi:hypothetical protein